MVGNLVLAVVLVRDDRFRPLLVVVVACLLLVVRMVVELVEARILELVLEQRRSRTALLKIEITRCTQFLEIEGLSSVHGCLASMDQAGFLFRSQSTHISSIDQGSEDPAEEVM